MANEETQATPRKKSKAGWVILLIFFILLVLAAAAGYCVATFQTQVTAIQLDAPERIDLDESAVVTATLTVTTPTWLPKILGDWFSTRALNTVHTVYSSSDESVMTVADDGSIMGLSRGRAALTVTAGGAAASAVINVGPLDPTTLTADETVYVQCDGSDSVNVNAKAAPEGADQTMTYEIADPEIAKVDKEGNVTGLSFGTTTITVTAANGITANVAVVSASYFTSASFQVAQGSVLVGDVFFPGLDFEPEELDAATLYADITFEVSDTDVIAYDEESQMFEALKPGTVTITGHFVSSSDITDTCTVTVLDASVTQESADRPWAAYYRSAASVAAETQPEEEPLVTEEGATTDGAHEDSGIAKTVFDQINAYRTENGLAVITWDDGVAAVCSRRAREIVTDFSHNGFSGTAENIYMSMPGPGNCFEAWRTSSMHNANMLYAGDALTGAVGCYYTADGAAYYVFVIG